MGLGFGGLRVSRSGLGLRYVDKAAGRCSLGRKPSRYCTPRLLPMARWTQNDRVDKLSLTSPSGSCTTNPKPLNVKTNGCRNPV